MDGLSPKVLDLVCQSLFSSDKRRVGTDLMLVDASCILITAFRRYDVRDLVVVHVRPLVPTPRSYALFAFQIPWVWDTKV